MEAVAFRDYFFGFHLFLYLLAAVVLIRVLWNQLRLTAGEEAVLSAGSIRPAYFFSTLFLLLFAAVFLVFGVMMIGSRGAVFPPILHQAAGIGSILYWFLLSCFVAQWGQCFGSGASRPVEGLEAGMLGSLINKQKTNVSPSAGRQRRAV